MDVVVEKLSHWDACAPPDAVTYDDASYVKRPVCSREDRWRQWTQLAALLQFDYSEYNNPQNFTFLPDNLCVRLKFLKLRIDFDSADGLVSGVWKGRRISCCDIYLPGLLLTVLITNVAALPPFTLRPRSFPRIPTLRDPHLRPGFRANYTIARRAAVDSGDVFTQSVQSWLESNKGWHLTSHNGWLLAHQGVQLKITAVARSIDDLWTITNQLGAPVLPQPQP